jgi:hypothetical protein
MLPACLPPRTNRRLSEREGGEAVSMWVVVGALYLKTTEQTEYTFFVF